MKYLNIVISGGLGTGKSSTAKLLAQRLGWGYISAGDFFRTYHKEHSIPLENILEVPEIVERNFDEDFKVKITTTPNTVFEGHYQGWNTRDIMTTFRVLIKTEEEILLGRIKNRPDEPLPIALKRREADKLTFKKFYGTADYLDPSYFNFVIDNTDLTLDETVENIYQAFQDAQSSSSQ